MKWANLYGNDRKVLLDEQLATSSGVSFEGRSVSKCKINYLNWSWIRRFINLYLSRVSVRGMVWNKKEGRVGWTQGLNLGPQGSSPTFQNKGVARAGGWPGLKMAALHRPLYKVSFHLGDSRGKARLLTGGSSPQLPLARPLPGPGTGTSGMLDKSQ